MEGWQKVWFFFKSLMLADYLALFGLVLAAIPLFSQLSGLVAVVFAVYIYSLAIVLVAREIHYSRKSRYSEAIENLHACSHKLRDAADAIKGNNTALAFESIKESLIPFAAAFSLITGTHCRACIKSIVREDKGSESNPDISTETFCRSEQSTKVDANKKALIRNNSDFVDLFSYKKTSYFSNDLSKDNPYLNSNWPADSEERKKFIKHNEYPYISTIVWPIRSRTGDGDPLVIAFLCVDSKIRNIFDRRNDIEMGAIIADTLYTILTEYRDKIILNSSL